MKNLEKIQNIQTLEATQLNTLLGGSKKDDIIPIDSGITSKKRDQYTK